MKDEITEPGLGRSETRKEEKWRNERLEWGDFRNVREQETITCQVFCYHS